MKWLVAHEVNHMAQLRTDVAMIKQIQYLYTVQGLSKRAIARCLGITPKTVRKFLKQINNAPPPVENKLPSPDKPQRKPSHWSLSIDWDKVHSEFLQGTSIKILHKEMAPTGVSYWMFNRQYNSQKPKTPEVTMRLIHNPGEKSFFDFADGIEIVDRNTGELTKTQLLVAVLPYSSYTWAEFIPNQKQANLMNAMERAFHTFGGITPYVTVDNMKPAVQKAHIYDPVVNTTFVEFANHWNFATLPARPRKPRDKAAVEGNIGIIQRSFFQEVRNQNFYSLRELNVALQSFLKTFNSTIMKEYGISRNDRFLKEKHLLKPLPQNAFEIASWRSAKVHPDCHIQVDRNFYSAPYTYIGLTVRVKITSKLIEIYDSQNQQLLTSHSKLDGKFKTSTNNDHYPEQKNATARFEIKYAQNEANKIGPNTKQLVEQLFNSPAPLRHLRRVQGILRLASKKTVSNEAIEHATKMAMTFNKPTFPYISATAHHFEKHGKRSKFVAPIRDQTELYLHQPQTKKGTL
jgi:hypothetical protein